MANWSFRKSAWFRGLVVALAARRHHVAARSKPCADDNLAPRHGILGLGCQGEGRLEAAFDYFRKLPFDDSAAALLYDLALDFERKRQFDMAEAVVRHVANGNPRFRDVAARISRTPVLPGTVNLGGVEQRTLGRYLVEKELGKGAPGSGAVAVKRDVLDGVLRSA